MAGDPRSPGQLQAGPQADAADGTSGDLPAAKHAQADRDAQSLLDRLEIERGQSSLMLGRHPAFWRFRLYIPMARAISTW